MNCDQCVMLSINGVACHETGCPNAAKRWDGEAWRDVQLCLICGYEMTEDRACCEGID